MPTPASACSGSSSPISASPRPWSANAPGGARRGRARDGQWQTNPSFGLQFRAQILGVVPPTTLEGIEAYLGSGMIKGIGRAMAGKLVAAFGEQVFEVIERQPERLREVPGIGRGLAGRITTAWRDQRAVRDIMLFLHSHGLSPLRAARIFEAYGERAIQAGQREPLPARAGDPRHRLRLGRPAGRAARHRRGFAVPPARRRSATCSRRRSARATARCRAPS